MKVLITGINGLVGKDIGHVFLERGGFDVYGAGRAECMDPKVKYEKLDLADLAKLDAFLAKVKPELIIHCAAYTKLDDCEKNQAYADRMNVGVTRFLAHHTGQFVYISSDAVFSGNKGNYKEEDPSDAVNYYGYTKYQGEIAAMQNKQALVVRSSIYGYNTNENQSIAEWGARNLTKGMQINGFTDVKFNPLYSLQLAGLLYEMVKKGCKGTFHLGSDTTVSKYRFFQLLAQALGKDPALVHPVSVASIDFLAKRTTDTSLDIGKISSVSGIAVGQYNGLQDGIRTLVADMKSHKRLGEETWK